MDENFYIPGEHAEPADAEERLPAVMLIIDESSKIAWASEGIESYWGIRRKDTVGKDFLAFIDHDLKPILEKPELLAEQAAIAFKSKAPIENLEFRVLPGGARKGNCFLYRSTSIKSGQYAGGRFDQFFLADGLHRTGGEDLFGHEHFRLFAEACPLGIVEIDEQYRIFFCNTAAAAMYGYTRHELIGRPFHVLLPEDAYVVHLGELERETKEGFDASMPTTFCYRGIKKNGAEFPLTGTIYRWESRGKFFISVLLNDRTETQNNSQEPHGLYSIFEGSSDLIAFFDHAGLLQYLNTAGRQLLGIDTKKTRPSLTLADIFPEWAQKKIMDEGLPVAAEEGFWKEETAVLTVAGQEVPVSQIILTHKNHAGRPASFFTMAENLTEPKRSGSPISAAGAAHDPAAAPAGETTLIIDPDLMVSDAHGDVEKFFSVPPEKIRGRKLGDMVSDSQQICCFLVKKMFASRLPAHNHHAEWITRAGEAQAVAVSGSLISDSGSRLSGVRLIIQEAAGFTDMQRDPHAESHRLIGKSRKMQNVFTLIKLVADTESTILITGETGTGKELAAEELHEKSVRAARPFIKVNCSAIPETLLESELFGHVKGAFTGAVRDKVGRFQLAEGGTIFLDEIGDISPMIQLKLLRILQKKEFERVGDTLTLKADIRIISATNKDLRKLIARGLFREDLYYRLKVMSIHLPPLRSNREDIPCLVEHFLRVFNARFNKEICGLSPEAYKIFMSYDWPGNVRELEHALEHAFVLCEETVITPRHIPDEIACMSPGKHMKHAEPVTDAERLKDALIKTGWNKTRAAKMLGLDRTTLYRKMKALNIDQDEDALWPLV
jgi:PAS domain S-box-containing protein